MSKPYCGYRSVPPKGQRLGTFEECMKKGQIRRYGTIAVTPEQLEKLVGNVKKITKEMPKQEVKKAIQDAQKKMTPKEEKQLEENFKTREEIIDQFFDLEKRIKELEQMNSKGQSLSTRKSKFGPRIDFPVEKIFNAVNLAKKKNIEDLKKLRKIKTDFKKKHKIHKAK